MLLHVQYIYRCTSKTQVTATSSVDSLIDRNILSVFLSYFVFVSHILASGLFPKPLRVFCCCGFFVCVIFFTVLISDILINPAGSFHTKLSPPAAHPQPEKDANVANCIFKILDNFIKMENKFCECSSESRACRGD